MDQHFYDELTDENLKEMLHEPKNKYRIYPINHSLCDAGSDQEKSVAELINGGAGGCVSNVTWLDPRWMKNPENLQRLNDAVELANKNGMQMWMYDEYYYSSGWANGYAAKDHPEYVVHFMDFYAVPVKAGENVTLPADNDGYLFAGLYDPASYALAQELPIKDHTVTAPADGLMTAFFHNRSYEQLKQEPGKSRGGLDFLNKDAVKSFIREGLQPVQDAIGINKFTALFTDEPTIARFCTTFIRQWTDYTCIPAPYADDLFDFYRTLWHEELRDHLMSIFAGTSLEARRIRIRYYKAVSMLARKNYTDQIRLWCHANGTLSSGHFALEEGLKHHVCYYTDYMRVVGGQDIPGCDVLCGDAQLYWAPKCGFNTACSFAPKYPSSLARLNGGNVTMLEICPVGFPEKVKKNPFKEFMGLSTYVIFGGITHYNAYGYYYIQDEEQHKALNRYVGRLLTLLRNAKPDTNVAVYYPIAQMQSLFALRELKHGETAKAAIDLLPETDEMENDMELLNDKLLNSGFDYHIIDEDHFLQAQLDDGLTCGLVHADTLIVPFSEFLPVPVMRKIKDFASAGGKVIFLKTLPRFDESGRDEELIELLHSIPYTFVPDFDALPGEITYPRGITFKAENMLMSPYVLNGKRFWFVINKTEEDITVEATGAGTLYDPEHDVWSPLEKTFVLPAERGMIIFEEA